jgi:hypothetical protein
METKVYMMMPMMINALKNVLDYKVPKCKVLEICKLLKCGTLQFMEVPKCTPTLECKALKLLVIFQNLDITHLSSPSSSNLVEEIS